MFVTYEMEILALFISLFLRQLSKKLKYEP